MMGAAEYRQGKDRAPMKYVSSKWRQSSIWQVAETKTSTPHPYSRSESATHESHGSRSVADIAAVRPSLSRLAADCRLAGDDGVDRGGWSSGNEAPGQYKYSGYTGETLFCWSRARFRNDGNM